MRCRTKDCEKMPAFIVYWPGQTSTMCADCTLRAKGVAETLGFHLPVHPLNPIGIQVRNEGTAPVKVYDAKGVLVEIVPLAKVSKAEKERDALLEENATFAEELAHRLREMERHSDETQAALAEVARLLDRNAGLAAALKAIADACECTCGECPCSLIAREALEKWGGEK